MKILVWWSIDIFSSVADSINFVFNIMPTIFFSYFKSTDSVSHSPKARWSLWPKHCKLSHLVSWTTLTLCQSLKLQVELPAYEANLQSFTYMRSHVVLEEVAGLETGTFQFTIKCFSDTRVWLTDPVSHFCHICTWLAHMCLAHIGTDMWSSVFSDMTGHCFSNVTPRLTFSLTAQVYLFLVWFISGRRLKILHGLGYSTQFHTFFILHFMVLL